MTGIHLDPAIAWILRISLGVLFATAAAHKVRDFRSFRHTLSGYELLPRMLLIPGAIGLVASEVLISIDLLTGLVTTMLSDTVAGRLATALAGEVGVTTSPSATAAAHAPWAGLAACSLLVLYGMAIGINLLRGRSEIDCGCLGPATRHRPLSSWLLIRNGILALGAILTSLPLSGRSLHPIDGVTLSGGVIVLALLFHTVTLLAPDAPRRPTLERSI